MKDEARELDDSEKQWRLRYDCLIEEQNLLKNREAAFRNQLNTLHQILAAVSPKRGFNLPTSPRRSNEEAGTSGRRSNRSSPPAKIRCNRDSSIESIPSQTENSNQSSQDFWVADIRGRDGMFNLNFFGRNAYYFNEAIHILLILLLLI